MSDNPNFYLAFEDKFRGPTELVRERLCVYQPLLDGIASIFDRPQAIDIGCGRGEWLELLARHGFEAFGVDLDEGMLGVAREAELVVEQGDGVARLAAMESSSLALVSAFHLVEHISFDQLETLVSEALRVLAPGGVLLMETPNPENLNVGAHSFYLDPTHEKPLPPKLLAFLPEFYGYHRFCVMRLQEQAGLCASSNPTLTNVLLDASPDYAVIAQKEADHKTLSKLDGPFESNHGVALEELAYRYDAAFSERIDERNNKLHTALSERIDEGNNQLHTALSERIDERHTQLHTALSERIDERHTQLLELINEQFANQHRQLHALEEKLQHQIDARDRTDELIDELSAVYNSRSWRLTSPLRWLMRQLRGRCSQGAATRVKAGLRAPTLRLLRYVDRQTRQRPRLRRATLTALRRLGLYNRAVRFYRNARMSQAAHQWRTSGEHPLTDRQRAVQAAWMPGMDELSEEEILKRIRAEVHKSNQKEDPE